LYKIDGPTISFHVIKSDSEWDNEKHTFVPIRVIECIPDTCQGCKEIREKEDLDRRTTFKNQKIVLKQKSTWGTYHSASRDITTSSDTTIETIMLHAFQLFGIPIERQVLWYGEHVIMDDPKKTLKHYHVIPRTSITIQKLTEQEYKEKRAIEASKRQGGGRKIESGEKGTSRYVEYGFKGMNKEKESTINHLLGTTLQSGSPPVAMEIEEPEVEVPPNGWQCKTCTYVNTDSALTACEICDTPK